MLSRVIRVLPGVLLLFASTVAAQSQSIVYPTLASSNAAAVPTGYGYKYVGCYNETSDIVGSGGVRALSNGNNSATNYMTVDACLEFCGHTQFAGLEYGRECYCSPYLSALSSKLNESRCDYACNGNASEICGGTLALSLYNRTQTSLAAAGLLARVDGAMGFGTAAFIALVVAAVL